jgi:hypothetical protein
MEAEIGGHKEIAGQGITDQDDYQRNEEVPYLLREAVPKSPQKFHFHSAIAGTIKIQAIAP